jgi:RNA polymerase sigma factor (sigma-70 family)
MTRRHREVFLSEDCITQLKAGGHQADVAMSRIYLTYHQQVHGVLRRFINRYPAYRGESGDLVHEAFFRMIFKIRAEDLQVENLLNFWIGIGRGILSNQARRDERTLLVQEQEERYADLSPSPEEVFILAEERDGLQQIFESLGGRCGEVLSLWYNHYSMKEIAEILGYKSEGAARNCKLNCFRKLRVLASGGDNSPFRPC